MKVTENLSDEILSRLSPKYVLGLLTARPESFSRISFLEIKPHYSFFILRKNEYRRSDFPLSPIYSLIRKQLNQLRTSTDRLLHCIPLSFSVQKVSLEGGGAKMVNRNPQSRFCTSVSISGHPLSEN